MALSSQPIKKAYQILTWQLLMIAALAGILFFLRGALNAWSALLGGLAYWLPTFGFVWRVFAGSAVREPKLFLMKFVTGEVLKLFLSGILFFVIVEYLKVNTLSVLIGFIGGIISFWIASLLFLAEDGNGVPS